MMLCSVMLEEPGQVEQVGSAGSGRKEQAEVAPIGGHYNSYHDHN